MKINFFTEKIKQPPEYYIDIQLFHEWIQNCVKLKEYKIGIISIIFTNDQKLLEINQQYLQKDYYTDIITFNYSKKIELSGDIFISIDRVKENAQDFNVSFKDEIKRVIIHGILHLMDYSDYTNDEKINMTHEENELLKLFPKQ